jgi:hypothetical protein
MMKGTRNKWCGNKEHFIHLEVRGGLFIGEIKGPITMSQLALTNNSIR